jgi:hypothetical protein
MTQYGGDFECTFKVVGRLAKLFKKYNIYEQFEVSINNESGGEHTSVHKVERVSSIVSRLNCHVRNSNNWELEQYKDCRCPAKLINTRTLTPLLARLVMKVRLPEWLLAPSMPARL